MPGDGFRLYQVPEWDFCKRAKLGARPLVSAESWIRPAGDVAGTATKIRTWSFFGEIPVQTFAEINRTRSPSAIFTAPRDY